MSKIILIDGDILVYRSACAAEKKYWHLAVGEDEDIVFPLGTKKADIPNPRNEFLYQVTVPEPVANACYNAKSTLRRIKDACSAYFAEDLIYRIYISSEDKSNYRYSIAKTKGYKENRKAPKPTHYHAVRKYLVEKHGAIEVFGQEADDELGIVQTENYPNSCIVSIDKDLLMIPGWHYNFVKEKFTHIQPAVAAYNFYMQMLTGDTVDNIPGIKGIGPKNAYRILYHDGADSPATEDKCIEWFHEAVENAYHDHFHQDRFHDTEAGCGNYEYFLEMARLLWIRRRRDEIWQGLNTVLGQDSKRK